MSAAPLTSNTSLICAGHRAGYDAGVIMEKSDGITGATFYAGGILSGLSQWLIQKHGYQAAYDMLSHAADEIVEIGNRALT